MDDRTFRRYKVIRISHIYAESKKDALKHAQEDFGGQYITVEFAVEELPRGFWGQILKQIIG